MINAIKLSRVSTRCLPLNVSTLDRLDAQSMRVCGVLSGVSRVSRARTCAC